MSRPVVRMWLSEPMEPEVRSAIRRLERLEDVARIAIMPDVHLGERVCVGCVVATRSLIYPAAVGGDIGCGIAAAPLEGGMADLNGVGAAVLRGVAERVPILRHRTLFATPELIGNLAPGMLTAKELAGTARREGRIEMGTLGRGNHFLELQRGDDGRLWLMVHSGSRVMGQAITEWHLKHATRAGGGMHWLDTRKEDGQAYLNDLQWALRYAGASRRLMLEAAADAVWSLVGARPVWEEYLDTNHNHVRREEHGGEEFLVHRKGASPAAEGEPGLIPGCMGGESFHVLGRGVAESLCSSSHGAGRALSRGGARQRIGRDRFRKELADTIYDERLADALREEAPSAYKSIRKVMRAQKELVRVVRCVRGLVTYKGG